MISCDECGDLVREDHELINCECGCRVHIKCFEEHLLSDEHKEAK